MANGTADQVTDDEWEYHPAQKAASDDEWDYAPAKSAPNLRTGEGMEAAAAKQAHQGTRSPLDNLHEKETALSMFTPTGITRDAGDPELERVRNAANVSSDVVGAMSMVPGAAGTIAERGLAGGLKVVGKGIARTAIGGAAGGAAGGYAGREIGGAFGHPEAGREIGAGIGGLTGGIAGAAFPEAMPSEGRFGKVFDLLRPEAEAKFPGASLPSGEEFYAKRGAEINAMRKLQPNAFAPQPEPFPGASLPLADEFYENRAKDLMARGRQQSILDRAAVKPKTTPFGEGMTSTAGPLEPRAVPSITENAPPPAEMPRVKSRAELRAEQGASEGIAGSVANPSGRLILTPEEAHAEANMQRLAEQRAKQHGMMYAAGMRPAGGGRVPTTPTRSITESYGGPRGEVPPEHPPEPIAPETTIPSPIAGEGLLSDIPNQPTDPRELVELSKMVGRNVSEAEVPELRRRLEAERNITEGLKGNRKDTAGEIREKHRAQLEKKGQR